jgi:hypothetical protein
MIRRLDNLWFRLLVRGHLWIVCRVAAHRRRETLRRLRRHLAWQRTELN